jgi:pimeloyl-ACP methyl ester carboxylesterase
MKLSPATRYARSGSLNIAYQVFGAGPPDVVLVPGFISHVEFAWHEPLLARFLGKLAAFARVIAFDKRGMGLSDRDPRRETPSLAERIDDIAAVMDAAGCPRAALLAWSEGGPASLLFARGKPERVTALMLVGTAARFTAAEDYPEGMPRDIVELFIDTVAPGPPLELLTGRLPDAVQGSPYSQILTADGGISPYEWTVVSGELPPGLTIDGANGLEGTPTQFGLFAFTVSVNMPVLPSYPPVRETLSINVEPPFAAAARATSPNAPRGTPGHSGQGEPL